ncbi:DUF3037 domain-containing protein [Sedimenticola selenatireducens]|uniref:DUF3037 domain-containing protein n=1 Tax=Sedimenticola selenatireducens TaxID=191960 RepID=UPI002AAB19A8|nr:DUF3037 domain-containing protein [Sedimenticola selenatireducens]
MKKTPCQYAIVRFTPFVETGEFANVGIVMMAPKARFFGFKLLTRRHKRITDFFKELDAQVFRSAMKDLNEELGRIRDLLKAHGFDRRLKINDEDFAKGMFAEMVRPRETIVRFGEPRVVLAEEPKKTLDELYAFYVGRDFVTKQYRERVLEEGIRDLLLQARVEERFHKERLGDEEFSVPFPFVQTHDKVPTKIIKPLTLAQPDSTRIIEHGGKWEFRIRELKKRNQFPERALFAVDGPTGNNRRQHAYQEALEMLEDTGVTIVPYDRRGEILDFALDR